jgi:hypothetical protein
MNNHIFADENFEFLGLNMFLIPIKLPNFVFCLYKKVGSFNPYKIIMHGVLVHNIKPNVYF